MNFSFSIPLLSALVAVAAEAELLLLKLAALFFLLLLHGVFVAAEFALVKIRSGQIELLAEEGDPRANFAREILDHLPAYLATLQIALSMTSLGLGWLGANFLAKLLLPLGAYLAVPAAWPIELLSFLVAFALLCYLHIVLGALVPKSLALRHSVTTTLWLSRPLLWTHRLLRPISWFHWRSAEWFLRSKTSAEAAAEKDAGPSDEELRALLEESEEPEGDESLGREIVRNALELKHRVACDIMTPRSEVVYLDLEDAFEEQIHAAISSRHTRFPLCRGHIDESVGLVHIKDLLALFRDGRRDLLAVRRDLHHVSEMMPLEKLLRFFLSKRAHLAIVVDEYGGALGIVTLDNVLEEIVGSIHDEFDAGEESEFRKISDDEFEFDGAMALHDVSELIDEELDHADVSTIGGYITAALGHIPNQGEKVEVGPFVVTVIKSDPRRVVRVHFRRQVPPTAPSPAEAEPSAAPPAAATK